MITIGAIVTIFGEPQHGRESSYFDTLQGTSEMLDDLVKEGTISDHKTFYPQAGHEPWTAVVMQIEAPTERLYTVLNSPEFQNLISQARLTCQDVATQIWGGGAGSEEDEHLARLQQAARTLGYL